MTANRPEREALSKEMSLFTLFSLAFGTIIGVGWITVLGAWLTNAGSLGAVIGFVIGGLIILVVALCYVEVATMYPVSGGEVAYIYEMFGPKTAFAAGWFLLFNYVALTSFEAISVGWILSVLLPGFEGPIIYTVLGFEVRLWSLVAGLAIMAIITMINYRGGRLAGGFQTIMTLFLLGASVVFIVFGIATGDAENLRPMFSGNNFSGALLGVLAIVATAPFWYSGFDTIPQAMGELRETSTLSRLPSVMCIAILLAIAFYALVILAASMSVPRETLLSFDLPVARAMSAAMNSEALGKLVLTAGLAGLITTWNAIFFAATRIAFALGRGRMIPERFAKVHPKFGAPAFAVLFVGLIGSVGTFFGRNAILPIVGASSIVLATIFVLIVLGTWALRKRKPNALRPFRAPGGQAFLFLALILGVLILISATFAVFSASVGFPNELLALAIWATLGALFWGLASKVRSGVSEEHRRWLILNQ